MNQKNLATASYLIVDWGTTNFRAFAMDEQHQLLATKEANWGLLQVVDKQFAQTLAQILSQWLTDFRHLPIYMAGMVGSAKGWFNVNYVQSPASREQLNDGAYQFKLPWGPAAKIFPGVSHQSAEEQPQFDVMRGEEIQLFGLSKLLQKQDFFAILPGTHSKHASFSSSKIASFSSFLTGEFYDVVRHHMMLGKGLTDTSTLDRAAFVKGVEEAQKGHLTNRIFLAWTHRLFNQLQENQVPDYLSGMLIGYELSEVAGKNLNRIYLVGGSSLSQRYQLAAEYLGISTEIYSGNDCFLAGMTALIKENNE